MEVIWQVNCKVTFGKICPNIAKNQQKKKCVPVLAAYLYSMNTNFSIF